MGMARHPESDDDPWGRSVWETDDEASLEPPGPPPLRKPAAEPDDTHPLLGPLARAQDAVARLEARAGAASPVVAEGLRARMAYREAAGWLSHAHIWIHPQDLALRDAGLTGSYSAAARAGRLVGELPATAAQGSGFDVPPSDLAVDQALRLARLWRRLAELRTWAPLTDAAAMREMLQSLGYRDAGDAGIEDWLAWVHMHDQGPALIRAGRAARDWMNRPHITEPLNSDDIFLAACFWREKGFGREISLPFWAASEQRHHRLALHVGIEWMAGFLDCVAEAAREAVGDLDRLQQTEAKGRRLARTARSRLPDALDTILRLPIVTARDLAKDLGVTLQAALGLLRQMLDAGIIREATGRASWRAFVIL
jgi:HTH DNA binding domain